MHESTQPFEQLSPPQPSPDSVLSFDSDLTGNGKNNSMLVVGSVVFAFVAVLLMAATWIKTQPGMKVVAAVHATQISQTAPAAPGASATETAPAVQPMPTIPYIMWSYSFTEATQRAQSEKKPIMIEFYTDWCGACKWVDANTFPDANVIAESQNFVSLKINAEAERELAARYGIRAFPTFVFTDSNGNVLSRDVGAPSPADLVSNMQAARSRYTPS